MTTKIQVELIDLVCEQHTVSQSVDEDSVLKQFGFILFDNLKLLESALDILDNDNDSIVKYTVDVSNRIVWKVKGSQGKEYTCLDSFCSCPSFLQQVRQDPSGCIMCKHLLGVKLATCLKRATSRTVNNDKFVELMCDNSLSTSANTSLNHYGASAGVRWQHQKR